MLGSGVKNWGRAIGNELEPWSGPEVKKKKKPSLKCINDERMGLD